MNLANELIIAMLAESKPSQDAIDEARARRDLVKAAAMTYEGALSFIKSGSLAHFTVNGNVSDADGSLILDRRIHAKYGPDGDGVGPSELIMDVAEYVRDTVKQVYPDVYISTNHKRAIYFRFRQPLEDGQDPTVDLVIGLNRKDLPGIWIPNLDDDNWDPSDPGKHTELVKARRQSTNHASSKVVRTLKLYSKQWDNELLASFHLTALMLEAYPKQKPVIEGVIDVLNHAAVSLEESDTDDPAGVSDPIQIPSYRARSVVLGRISNAAVKLQKAYDVRDDNEEALDEVVALFGEIFAKSAAREALEGATVTVRRKVIDRAIEQSQTSGTPVLTQAFDDRPVLNTRSFDDRAPAAMTATAKHPVDLSLFEIGMKPESYFVLHRHVDDYRLIYTVNIKLPDRSRMQLVTVEITARATKVIAHGQSGLRHVNGDGSLCLWHPADSSDRRWTPNKGLVSLLDLVALHLYKEDRFKVTGVWLGDEVHHD